MDIAPPSRFRSLTSPKEALDIICTTLEAHPTASTVALIEHRAARRGFAVPVEGPDPGIEWLHHLDELLLETFDDCPGTRLVLATLRRGEDRDPNVIEEADLDHWRRLHARHVDRDLELLEWFLIHPPDVAVSMAETVGHRPRWGPTSDRGPEL